ncbi:MAG: enoyl-CoA hydratase-related protein [Bacillota bacterium]|nr:enoyl-CoA hydratase-related protein [Bacillota bacterium]
MDSILLEVNNHIAIVTINRADSLNSFNFDTLLQLEGKVKTISQNQEIWAVIFTGAGEKAFSVGADLKERRNLTNEQVIRNLNQINSVFNLIDQLPKPTIAAINGYAFGGGMELALTCDFRIAAYGSQMGLTETSLAIIPGAGGTQRLPRLIGTAKALELILTAKRFPAEEAMSFGLLTKVVPNTKVLSESLAFAEEMLMNGPIAIQQAKLAIKNGMDVNFQQGLEIEQKAYEKTIPTDDRLEALQAFLEKRKPVFKGK